MARSGRSVFPQSLRDWQTSLSKLDLPVDPAVQQAALLKLHSNSANTHNVAEILSADPAICALLLSTANRSLNTTTNEAQSLPHCISLLGFPRVEQLIKEATPCDEQNFAFAAEFWQQLLISQHACQQVTAWAQHNPYWSTQDLYWPTLLHHTPLWVLWYKAGPLMQKLQARRQGANHFHSEQALLGTHLQVLSATLCRHWRLPQLTQQSWQPSYRGNARQWIMLSRILPQQAQTALQSLPRLLQTSSSNAFAVALGNRFAQEAAWDWYSPRTLRLQRIAATALRLPLDTVIAINHQQAAEFSRQTPRGAALSPASSLLSFARKESAVVHAPDGYTDTDTANNFDTAVHGDPGHGAKKAAIEHIIKRLKQQPQSFQNVSQIFDLALSTVHQQLNMERTSAMLVNLGSKKLRTVASYGTEDSPELARFGHQLVRGDLFNKLLQKTSSLHLQSSNHLQIWPLLPGTFKQACGADQFFIHSIFVRGKPAALLYADCGESNRPLTEQQYDYFKRIAAATSDCLQAMASR